MSSVKGWKHRRRRALPISFLQKLRWCTEDGLGPRTFGGCRRMEPRRARVRRNCEGLAENGLHPHSASQVLVVIGHECVHATIQPQARREERHSVTFHYRDTSMIECWAICGFGLLAEAPRSNPQRFESRARPLLQVSISANPRVQRLPHRRRGHPLESIPVFLRSREPQGSFVLRPFLHELSLDSFDCFPRCSCPHVRRHTEGEEHGLRIEGALELSMVLD